MVSQPLRILQINSNDNRGGAARVAWNLHQAYLDRGIQASMAVGWKYSDDANVQVFLNDEHRNKWARTWLAIADMFASQAGDVSVLAWFPKWLRWIGQPRRALNILRGYEDFSYPGINWILKPPNPQPQIIHCHNLHDSYFNLRALPWLSSQTPVIVTLHDAWLLSGHCAHSLDCERWKYGCGECPYLSIYPPIRRDMTASNWRRKQSIYAQSQLYVATPSRWLMQKVNRSMLASAVVEERVIPYGVEQSTFHPADRRKVRDLLEVPQDAMVLLTSGFNLQENIWKDFQSMRDAISLAAERLPSHRLLLYTLGGEASSERIGQVEVRLVPYQNVPENVAQYYQAADVYVHSAHADTFPNMVLEALACGTPVVATDVGGIPEQVKDNLTGFLVPSKDAGRMSEAIIELLTEETLRIQMGYEASQDARIRFGLRRQVDAYLEWYRSIIDQQKMKRADFQPA